MVGDLSFPGERGSLMVLLVLVVEAVAAGDDSVAVLSLLALVGEAGVEVRLAFLRLWGLVKGRSGASWPPLLAAKLENTDECSCCCLMALGEVCS